MRAHVMAPQRSGRPLGRRVGRPVRSLSQLRRLYGAPPLPGRDLVLFDLGESEPLRARAHGHASEGQFRWSGVVRRVVMGLPRALALGCLVKNLPDQGNIVVSSRHHWPLPGQPRGVRAPVRFGRMEDVVGKFSEQLPLGVWSFGPASRRESSHASSRVRPALCAGLGACAALDAERRRRARRAS